MRLFLSLLFVFIQAPTCRADCLPIYAAAAELNARLPGWLVPSAILSGAGLLVGEPVLGAGLATVGLVMHTKARLHRHLAIQPVVLLVQARRGFGGKLGAVARDFNVDPSVLGDVVRELDQRNVFCRPGLMNEPEMLEQVAIRLRNN